MEYKLSNLEPKEPLRFFEEICQIPHGSHNEEQVSRYLVEFAKQHRLEYHTDELFNVIIKKPGQNGGESTPPIALQGHTDMVCEKNNDTVHDFRKDPIRYFVDGDLLRADGTTLGADNGTAVCIMLALLEDRELAHPPLECLFTSQEETGLGGAERLDADAVSARRMLNLDCGPEGVAVAGSAGGLRVNTRLPVGWTPVAGDALQIEIKGLRGGHSGAEIHECRGNANKLMGRVLYALLAEGAGICGVRGGAMDNAIPRECIATVTVPEGKKEAALETLRRMEQDFQMELAEVDGGVKIAVSPAAAQRQMDKPSAKAVVDYLNLCPNGVQVYSWELGVTVTSVNLAVVQTEADSFRVTCSIRSSVDSLVPEVRDRLLMLAELLGGSVTYGSSYPSWGYQKESALRELAVETYRSMTGKELEIRAVHGGLECGVFKKKWPDMDIIALGHDLDDPHSPDERMSISSYDRLYRYVRELLGQMCK